MLAFDGDELAAVEEEPGVEVPFLRPRAASAECRVVPGGLAGEHRNRVPVGRERVGQRLEQDSFAEKLPEGSRDGGVGVGVESAYQRRDAVSDHETHLRSQV